MVVLAALLALAGLSVVDVGQAYGAAPVIKSVVATGSVNQTGSANGGTAVTINGTGFTGATAVVFGTAPATSFTVSTSKIITAVAPPAVANSAAAVDVVVTVGGVNSTPEAAGDNVWTYTWTGTPAVTGTGLIPATTSQTGSTITFTAAGTWTAGQLVYLSGFANNLNQGTYSVVTGGSGSFTISYAGTTTAGPGMVSPTQSGAVGAVAGGTSVVIDGSNFGGATGVDFGATAATSFVVNTATRITAVAPAGTQGPTDITVTIPATPPTTSPATPSTDSFTYLATPTVTGVTTTANPAGGPDGGGTQVTISGTSFNAVSAVKFGSTPAASFQTNSLDSINAVSPAGTGAVDVTVTTTDGTSTTSSADTFTYNSTLAVANGTAAYSNSAGTDVPVTGTSQSGTTVTVDAIGTWNAGNEVQLTGMSNGIPTAIYTITNTATGSFNITYAPTVASGTGTVVVLNTITPDVASATTQSGSSVTISAIGTWYAGQKVYLNGMTDGPANGNYAVTAGGNGQFTVTGTTTANCTSGTCGNVMPYQAESFNAASLITGGGTISPTITVTAQPASGGGTVEVEGDQLIYIPAQSTFTSYVNGASTTWLQNNVTTTGTQTATFQVCQTAPTATCTSATMTYVTPGSGYYVGNQLSAGAALVAVVEDTGNGLVAPTSAASGSTFTTISAPSETDLPSTDSGFTVTGIGGYQSITPVPTGVTLVPGSLSVSGGDLGTSGQFTVTYCTAAMGYVAGTCTANFTGNYHATYPYIETSLNVATFVPGGTQLSLPTVTASWQVTASSGTTLNAYETEFVVTTNVETVGILALDAYPSNLASYQDQGLGGPVPAYAAPLARWSVNVTAGGTAPAFTSANSTTFTVGSSGTFDVTASGSPPPTLSESGSDTLPSGVTFDAGTGVLSGTPAAGSGGTYTLNFTAANGIGSNATQTFTLTVDEAPAFTSGTSTAFTVGTAGTFDVTASGFPAPTLSESGSDTLPSGVTFDAGTGVLSGTPAAGSGGTYTLNFTAANGIGSNATQTFTLTVDEAPAFTSGTSTAFTVGTAGTFDVTASGFPAPTLSESGSDTLPSGVTFDAGTGVLSGTPAAGSGGTYTLNFTAANGIGSNATQTFTLTVDEAPAFTSATSTAFTIGATGTFTVTASGSPVPTLSESDSDTLPTGVTFDATTGVLSGNPMIGSSGTYTLHFTASNGVGTDASQTFTLTVSNAPEAPEFTSADSTTFTVGAPGTFTVTASGSPTPTLSESNTDSLPSGVTFDASTGVLSGTPAAGSAGTYTLNFTAANGVGTNATQSFTLTVDAAAEAPAFTSTDSTTFTVGTTGTFDVTATGNPAPTLSESDTDTLPSGVTFDPSTGELSGTPAAGTGGTYTLNFTAANGVGSDATQVFTLTVNEAPAFTSADATTFTAGSPGTFTVMASGSPAPTLSESDTDTLPSGISFDATTGVLSGTPAAGTGGTYTLNFTAANGVGSDATQVFTLTVNEAPAFTSADSTTFTAGAEGTFTVAASGNPTPTFSESDTDTLPSGVSFDATTGVLSGTPGAGTGGTYTLNFTAANGVGSDATQVFTLTVNEAPAFTSADSTTFTAGAEGTFTVAASGNPTPTLSESDTDTLPSGVMFDPSTGELSGTPGAGTGGTYTLNFTAANGVGSDAIQVFTLTVATGGFQITTSSLPDATVGTPYSEQLTTSGAPDGAVVTWKKVSLPKGFALSASGLLTGTPSSKATGAQIVDVSATDATHATPVTATIPLTVNWAAAFGKKSPTAAGFTEGQAGSVTVTATGSPTPAFSLSGSLPSGLSFDTTTGVLSGTPAITTDSSLDNLTIQVSNGISTPVSETFALSVYAPLVVTTASLTIARGSAVPDGGFQLATVTGVEVNGKLTLKASGLPKGLSLKDTGLLTGTVKSTDTAQTYTVTITASSKDGKTPVTSTNTATITVT